MDHFEIHEFNISEVEFFRFGKNTYGVLTKRSSRQPLWYERCLVGYVVNIIVIIYIAVTTGIYEDKQTYKKGQQVGGYFFA